MRRKGSWARGVARDEMRQRDHSARWLSGGLGESEWMNDGEIIWVIVVFPVRFGTRLGGVVVGVGAGKGDKPAR